MATIEQLNAALVKADSLGNAADARSFADEIRRLRSQTATPEKGYIESGFAGLGSGVGNVALGAQRYLGQGLDAIGLDSAGKWLVKDATQGRAKLEGEVAPYKAANPIATGAGELAGEVISTLPVGGALGAGAKAVGATRLGTALRTGGVSTGANVAPSLGGIATDMGIRVIGGAGTGAATAGLVNPESVGLGAAIGGAFPVASKVVGSGFNALGASIRPFTASGQEKIAGSTLRDFATNPKNALAQLLNSREVIAGSAPTTAMAAGDDGLAALSRSLQNADVGYASNLAARQTAQNQARTAELEAISGNTGKIALAKAARDKATGPMRESVLDAAGSIPSGSMLASIDRLIANPNNAGTLSQQALNDFKGRISKFSKDGQVDARALYAIRKDIGDVLSGKLQGESGNIRYASGQLNEVKGLIDEAIDLASRRVNTPPTGTSVMPYGSNVSTNSIPSAATGPRSSWSDYLQAYTTQSIPINQMERLDKVLKAVQTGSVDSQGGLILSAAKLNNILKNESNDLIKSLSPNQMDILRRVSADLNAGQIANNTGRAVGSNTVQNLAQNQLLTGALGKTMGGSTIASSTLGRLLQLPYGAANKQIQERLGNSLLNPEEAARLMQTPEGNRLLELLSKPAARITSRVAPVIIGQ